MNIALQFATPGYIADPYRIERYRLIEIQKQSGMMRARSDKKRREALENHLRSTDQTLDDYQQLEDAANQPFYKNDAGHIIIPSAALYGMLVNANDEISSSARVQNIRTALKVSDFVTDKTEPDGKWERFAVVKSGTGMQLSNQRSLRINQYIEEFTATGTIDIDAEMVKPEALINLLKFAGRVIGLGSSRKMGWGRFLVAEHKK